jgi:hypothetical protein
MCFYHGHCPQVKPPCAPTAVACDAEIDTSPGGGYNGGASTARSKRRC